MTKTETKNSTDLEEKGKSFSIQTLVGFEKLDSKASYDEILERVLNNITIASLSIYVTARDLSFAKTNLSDSDWIKLTKSVPYSITKIDRLVQIGSSHTLERLNDLKRLPDEWTTQYYISQNLKSEEKNKLLESDEMTAGCSLQKIKSIVGVKTKPPTSVDFDIENETRVLSIYVDKSTASAPKILEMQSEIENLINSTFHNAEQDEGGVLQVQQKLDEKNFIMIRKVNLDRMLSRQIPTDAFVKETTLDSEEISEEDAKTYANFTKIKKKKTGVIEDAVHSSSA